MKLILAILKRAHAIFTAFLFDPRVTLKKIVSLPFFINNLIQYKRLNKDKAFSVRFLDIWYSSYDRFSEAATVCLHYFYQDIWAARILFSNHINEHVDVGSSLSGFISHILPFCRVTYVDIRPLNVNLEGFEFRKGSITNMPFNNNSVSSLSCLHVIEHIGLGRYGDPVDPEGYIRAAKEIIRILKPGGLLILGTPVGRERLCFDGHRIFNPQRILGIFPGFSLLNFSLIDDEGKGIISGASFEQASSCNYGCGLFLLKK